MVASAWLTWQFATSGQYITSQALGPYGAASYWFSVSVQTGDVTETGNWNSLHATFSVTISNWAGQKISGQLFNDVYYYGGNQVIDYYGFNGNICYGNSNILPNYFKIYNR
ncbi:hypothetical protein [Sulfurisphaera tokodaii]|uniref:Uncharacterized protein n=2 Tax=Sulfurisphaera tokodaii TaxID=111955 RepID=Q96ZV7_SULTO|nr:hypothetical protein [Sulfurisphaera tokodaii]BAB66816.1 hypothetical protein STK_17280 [Sulfurisphaera tokodaii str. 7]HII73345.1 hypothetical protein [Sulfurisphaera tokodaii]